MKKKAEEYSILIETVAKKDIKKGEKIRIKLKNIDSSLEVARAEINRGTHFLKK